MTTYGWPRSRSRAERDDAAGRASFLLPRRTDFDLAGALAASRAAPEPPRTRGRRPAPAAPTAGRSLLWLPMGPSTVISGQAIGKPRVSGRVRALAVQENGERVYAAAANGGVWYSGDGGASWASIGGLASTPGLTVPRLAHRHACGAIHVHFAGPDAADAADDVVYVGTGEPGWQKGQPGGKLGGVGVLVATGPAATTPDDPWTIEAGNLAGAGIYRIAEQPGGTAIVAATTKGLYQRPANPTQPWTKVAGDPFDDYEGTVTDVVWTAAGTGRPERLWAWASAGDEAGLWVRAAGQTDFEKIATAGAIRSRAVLAAATPPSRIYVFNNRGESTAPGLFQVTAASAATPTATLVTGVPATMLGKQGEYDLAMAVDPSNPARVVLGGSFTRVDIPGSDHDTYEGAIYTGTVGGTPLRYQSPTHIGIGVHADIHFLTHSGNGARLYVSCDGGVFRSDNPTEQAGFFARNDGLAVIQANYLGAHPRCEGHVVCGLQDNGIIERTSNGVWRHTGGGDGGGVALDPVSPHRYTRQFYNASWTNGPLTRLEKDEDTQEWKDSSFYATPAAIAHTIAAPPAAPLRQLLIPTTRVWYSGNWGTSWQTLPTGTDAIDKKLPQQDVLAGQVLVCRWQTSHVAWVLTDRQIHRFVRTAGSETATTPGSWARSLVLEKSRKNKKDETSAEGPIREAPVWTDLAVNLDAGGAVHGSKGAVYLGTTGHPDNADVDTLWWFDGTNTWHPTNLRKDPRGVPAPVTAVLADPAHPETVYVGTTVGVWRGVRTLQGANPPTWEWEKLVNGLAEACVEDLALFDDGGIQLLRAGIVSRGVWELRLDADVEDLTYLRCHDDDLRYRVSAVEVARDLSTTRSWHGSPDVRPRRASMAAVPVRLPWTLATAPSGDRLRRFQAALRSRFDDPRFRATGEWDLYFDACLRDHGVPTPGDTVTVDRPFFDDVVKDAHATADPWGPGLPTEADLWDQTSMLTEGTLARTSMAMTAGDAKVDVVVHRRGLDPIAGNQVRVTLLRWIDEASPATADPADATTWFSGDIPWAAAVDDVLNSDGGTTSSPLGPGWTFMGTTAASRRKTLTGQALDNTHPGVATFDLDLSGLDFDQVVLLVAIIRADGDSAIPTVPLRQLALGNPHVAVRSVRVL